MKSISQQDVTQDSINALFHIRTEMMKIKRFYAEQNLQNQHVKMLNAYGIILLN